MKIDLNELEALARAATPGPWELNRHGAVIGGPVQQYANGKGQNQLAMATGADWMRLDEMACNAAHIAAANPSAVLELIALARQAGGAGMAAIPLVTAAELSAVISWLDNGCDPKEAAKELRSYRERAAAPVAQQGGGELPQDEREFVEAIANNFDSHDRETDEVICRRCSAPELWIDAREGYRITHRPECIVLRARAALAQRTAPADDLPPLTMSVYGTRTAIELERKRRADMAQRAASVPAQAGRQGDIVIGFPDPEAVFAQFCEREGYPSDGDIDEALRKAFYEGSKLGYPAASVQPDCGACPGDGTACAKSCKVSDESPQPDIGRDAALNIPTWRDRIEASGPATPLQDDFIRARDAEIGDLRRALATQAAPEVASVPDAGQFQAGVVEGYERAAKALGERAAGWREEGDFDLEEEVLQCRSMLHDQKPAAARLQPAPAVLLERAAQVCDQQADGTNGPYRSACLQCANAVRALRGTAVNAGAEAPPATNQETLP